MIRDFIIKREKLIKTIDKEKIANKIINVLSGYEVIFIYFSGSIAYQTFISSKSDYDINCFVKGFSGAFKIDIDGMDVFIYSEDYLTKRFDPNSNLSEYKKCFIDDYFALDKTLIYLNPKFEKDMKSIKILILTRF